MLVFGGFFFFHQVYSCWFVVVLGFLVGLRYIFAISSRCLRFCFVIDNSLCTLSDDWKIK